MQSQTITSRMDDGCAQGIHSGRDQHSSGEVGGEQAGAKARVTVVIPTHNRPDLLDVAVHSLFQQTFTEWEAVVVDDASFPAIRGDRWPDHAERIRLLSNSVSIGGAGAKAAGASVVTSEFIAFLDDDDLYHPGFLKEIIGAFDRNPDLDVIFAGVKWFGKDADRSGCDHQEAVNGILGSTGTFEKEPDLWVFDRRLFEALLQGIPMPFQRPCVRMTAMHRIGPYRPECLLWDNDWALRAALIARCALLNKPIYYQRDDGQGYHSKSDRLLVQMQSALEMTLQLHRMPPGAATLNDLKLMRSAASRNAFSIGYHLSRQGDFPAAMQYWLLSQRLKLTFRTLKFPLGAVARLLWQKLELRAALRG